MMYWSCRENIGGKQSRGDGGDTACGQMTERQERKWRKCSGALMFYTIDKAQGRLFISFLAEQPANIGECVHVNKLKRRTKQKQNKVGPGWSTTGNQIVSLFPSDVILLHGQITECECKVDSHPIVKPCLHEVDLTSH